MVVIRNRGENVRAKKYKHVSDICDESPNRLYATRFKEVSKYSDRLMGPVHYLCVHVLPFQKPCSVVATSGGEEIPET